LRRCAAVQPGRTVGTDTKVLFTRLPNLRILAACRPRAGIPLEILMIARSLVSIVDDDESVRESLPPLVEAFGFATQVFASAEAFLASGALADSRCLLLDVAMPGMSGPDLQRELVRRGVAIPVIFITAHQDDALRKSLLDLGAAGCLFKPLDADALRQVLETATGGG
jgi:FixJ family two-component response regulator